MTIRSLALAFLLCCTICTVVPVHGADPDPLRDYPVGVNDTGFILRDSFTNGDVTSAPGGVRVGLNIDVFPALSTQGITNVQFQLLPCGINPPHTHPRATELLTVISGGPLQAGLVDTKGEAFIYVLYPGDIIVFPRGLLHFELNVGNETAYFISALNSQNPGTLTAGGALLKLPGRAAASAFNTNLNTIASIEAGLFAYGPELQLDPNSGCIPNQDITSTTF